jgi:hypothetical protein
MYNRDIETSTAGATQMLTDKAKIEAAIRSKIAALAETTPQEYRQEKIITWLRNTIERCAAAPLTASYRDAYDTERQVLEQVLSEIEAA